MTRVVSTTLLCLLMLSAATGYARNDRPKQQLSGPAIQQNAVLQVEDPRFAEMQAGSFSFTNVKVIDEIMLLIDLKTYNPTANFTTTVNLSLEYEEWNGSQFVSQTKAVALTVNYASEGTFKDKAVYRFANAHKLKVTVSQTTGPVTGLVLQGLIDVTRHDHFDLQTAVAGNITHEFKAERNELFVSWDAIPGAEEYDLEWTWVNDYGSGDAPRNPSAILVEKNMFRLNSSRVTIVGRQYAVPLLYDRGYIIYRLRAIGRQGAAATPVEGKWSYEPLSGHTVASAPHKFLFQGHQNNLNWQATISYAEEGKNKAAISYFDGSLRNRQSVSRINAEDKIIVGETLYDHQGRPAIQVLPVPTNESRIGYQRSFNLNQEGKPYSRENFGEDGETECEVAPPGMSTASGASRYYSPANPDKNGAQAYLPDAKEYPFTQTEYTPDNTGRIRRQSGVGPDHKLGSGHETKYFYGKPSQEELDKMFGADVGYAAHYKKNMVVDANGQISVSYLDPQGKVIATSLAGETPPNLINIAKPEETVTTTVDLLAKVRPTDRTGPEDKIAVDGKSRNLGKEMLVTQQGTFNFSYDVKTNNFTDDCAFGPDPKPLCYGCVVDVSISVTDDCGNEVIPGIGADGSTLRQVGAINLECAAEEGQYANSFSTLNMLQPGNYTLGRKIEINEEALNTYTEDYLARQGECFFTFEHFLQEEAQNINIFDCNADCQSCRDAVGDYGKYSGPNCDPCLTQEEYNDLLAECDFLCNDELVQCSNAYNMMLADVSPFGQYGEVMNTVSVGEDGAIVIPPTNPDIDPSQFPLSVFNEQNKLPKNKNNAGHWKFPKDGLYRTEEGAEAMVDVVTLADDEGVLTYSPEVEASAIPTGTEHGTVFQVPPHKLVHLKDFLANWEPAWAEQLVHLHPEYGYYNFCIILENSHRWDSKWLATDTYEEAVENGYMADSLRPNPLLPGSAITDPYFTEISDYLETQVSSNWISYNNKEFQAMTRSINKYAENFDLWYVVDRTVNCPYDDTNSAICQACPVYDGINTDAEWNTFKSMYFSLKQQFVERKTSLYAIANDCYNGCIGTQYYSPFSFSFYKHNVFDFSTTLSLLVDSDQPCNWRSWKTGIYAKKSKRFPLSTDMINISEMDLEACYTGFDETTLVAETLPPDQQTACSNSLRDILEDTKLEADANFYETCGQCPIVLDLQNLMNAVAVRKELEKDNVQLSCYPESNYPEFVPDLKAALELAIPGDGKWHWDKVSSSNGELVVNLTKLDNSGPCELRLKFLTTGATFADVESVCCVNYTAQPTYYPLTGKGNFLMRVGLRGRSEKVVVEGLISCLDLTTCPFPPKCEPTKEAGELQTMMNSLLFDFTLGGTSQALFSTSAVKLYEPPYKGIVEGTLAPLQQSLSGTNWTWRTEIAGNVLTGYIEDGAGGRCLVELRPATNIPFDVRKIVGFANIRPDRKHPDDPSRYFLITAIVDTDQGKARVKMTGYSGCLAIGTCTPVTQP